MASASTASADASGSQQRQQGKSQFYMESIRLTDSLIRGQLFGHGKLRLESRPEDYGEMRVYLGSSSLGEMTPAKEETYRIARVLGVPSNSRVIALPACLHEFCITFHFFKSSSDLAYCLITSNSSLTDVG